MLQRRIIGGVLSLVVLGPIVAIFIGVQRSYIIPALSNAPSLLTGDFIFFEDKSRECESKACKVLPGSMWVFYHSNDVYYVKRVVGLPGDIVLLKNNELFINEESVLQNRVPDRYDGPQVGTPWEEKEIYHLLGENLGAEEYQILVRADSSRTKDFGPVRVPDGHYFVLGDNRDNSMDSRHWGAIPIENMAGPVTFIAWPPSRFGYFE